MKLQAFQKCKKLTKYPNFRKKFGEPGMPAARITYQSKSQLYMNKSSPSVFFKKGSRTQTNAETD